MRRTIALLSLVVSACTPAAALANDAMLVLLDRSRSMASNWTTASQGIVTALDQDAFDALDLGLIAAPTGSVTGPACIFNIPVECLSPSLPQHAIGPAGPKSTVGPGKRRDISDWLAANSPNVGLDDAFPLYEATHAALAALQAWVGSGRRILVVITDGGISCGQLSGRPGYTDCNGCDHEWENPENIATLVAQANASPLAPVETFVIGVPGAQSYDPAGCTAPPYHMRRALSAIAASGSPGHVPDGCDGAFTQNGGDPVVPCHRDLFGGSFTGPSLLQAITAARDEILLGVPVRDIGPAPRTLDLATPRPNPARSRTLFRFALPGSAEVNLSIHDISGRLVYELTTERLEGGRYAIEWDLRDRSGVPVPGGIYLVRASAGGETRGVKLSIAR